MKTYNVPVVAVQYVTHNVLRVITKKPTGYIFEPGQAADVAISYRGWSKEFRPFTFTNLPVDDHLEFMIKIYPEHNGMTNRLKDLKPPEQLILGDTFGAISFKGPGVFIAGGAGITPFISILRSLKNDDRLNACSLIFANKSKEDIIMENELYDLLDGRVTHIFSEEDRLGFDHGHIDKQFLQEHIDNFDQEFYVCGPPAFMESVLSHLVELQVESRAITIEI